MAIRPNLSRQFDLFLEKETSLSEVIKSSFKLLDDGKTPMQVEDGLFDFDLSTYQVAKIASAIYKFHTRGLEFLKYWNKRNNLSENANIGSPEDINYGFSIKKRK